MVHILISFTGIDRVCVAQNHCWKVAVKRLLCQLYSSPKMGCPILQPQIFCYWCVLVCVNVAMKACGHEYPILSLIPKMPSFFLYMTFVFVFYLLMYTYFLKQTVYVLSVTGLNIVYNQMYNCSKRECEHNRKWKFSLTSEERRLSKSDFFLLSCTQRWIGNILVWLHMRTQMSLP